MIRLLALLGIVLLQIEPGVTRVPPRLIEPQHFRDEAEVDSLMPTTGVRVPVLVDALDGLPVGPRERAAFLQGFRGAFQEGEIPTEFVAVKTGAVRPGTPVRNELRLAEGVDEKGAWSVRVRLEWFAPRDSAADSLSRAWPGRSARVTVTVGWPEGTHVTPPALPRAEWLGFPAGPPADAAYYQHAGWQVGLLVLEAVQRTQGDLGDEQRLRLDDPRRSLPVTAR